MLEPSFLAELEAFNCLWLEGLWYHIGQLGRFGQLIEQVFEDLRQGKTKTVYSLTDNVMDLLRKKYKIFWLIHLGLMEIKNIQFEKMTGRSSRFPI